MSDDLFLIAHLCRGEPTFDIAVRQRCAVCGGVYIDEVEGTFECKECIEGFWYILATPGYRAYPWWTMRLDAFEFDTVGDGSGYTPIDGLSGPQPSDAIDVFACNDRPSKSAIAVGAKSLLASLGLIKPQAPIKRRL